MIGDVDHPDGLIDRIISVSAVVLTRPDGAVVAVRKRGTDRFMPPREVGGRGVAPGMRGP